jgi:hypothetical protein
MNLIRTALVTTVVALLACGDARAQTRSTAATLLLERAFANRYDLDFSADIDLIMQHASGRTRVRKFRALSKVIRERTHSIGRLTSPEYLRGMTILTIEASGRGHDSFVYLPSLDKVRRVSTAQRGDSFLGSDVTYEDMERRRLTDYRLAEPRPVQHFGEAAYSIAATRVAADSDEHIEFIIAAADAAILATRHFRAGDTLHRSVDMPREHMVDHSGHVLPTLIEVTSGARSTTTRVVFHNLVVNPSIESRYFSVATLDQNRRLPGEAR